MTLSIVLICSEADLKNSNILRKEMHKRPLVNFIIYSVRSRMSFKIIMVDEKLVVSVKYYCRRFER